MLSKRMFFQAGLTLLKTSCISMLLVAPASNGLASSLIPFPTQKPVFTDPTRTNSLKTQASASHTFAARPINGASVQPLKSFFAAFDQKDGDLARKLKAQLSHPLDIKIAQWMMATTSSRGYSYQTLRDTQKKIANWPGQATMALAQENTLVKAGRANVSVARALPARPSSEEGKLLQVQSFLNAGDRNRAAALIGDYWISQNFTAALERQILNQYGTLLSQRHHKARAERLLYDERVNGALRLLPRLSKSDQALMKARVAVIRKQSKAGQLLANLPASAKREPGYFFAKVQHLRRADKWLEAAKVMMAAPTAKNLLVDPDEWWIERRIVSRKVLEAGHPKFAYNIASNHAAKRAVSQVDAEFHSGWYALRFLNNPSAALKHFKAIQQISSRPLSQSRALYWMARAYQASGNKTQAISHYKAAGRYAHTYYGQLALQAMGHNSIKLPRLPSTDSARVGFNANGFVKVIKRLNEAGQSGRTNIFYRHLAQTLTSPAELTLLASLADENKLYSISLQIGKIATGRGIKVQRLAFPLGAIPKSARISNNKKALAYAIARQESAFNKAIVSHADARGLMQLLPGTAKQTARSIGIPFKPELLTRDAGYNARLGTSFLSSLIERFGGSYPLAFVGYNAGPRRSSEWITRFGDPRKNAIDAVDWVEAIPFSETRNYVQRVMENYQVYRHRLENAPLSIHRDLNGGIPS